MMTTCERLDRQLRTAGIPIIGVSIGDPLDRATWRVKPSTLQTQAQPVIDALVLPTDQQLADETATNEVNRKDLIAVATALWECIPNPMMTKAQMKARAVEVYKTL
jgi:hypothetical protein